MRPDSEYQKAVLAGRDQPPRRHLWNGTDEQFEAWKQAEVRSWLESRRASKPYHPSRAGLRLVPAKEPPGDALEDFHVVEMPKEGAVVFDERMLRDPVLARDRLNRPVVVYRVANDMQNAFGLFTERNIGLPLALVVDGVWLAAPVIRDRLTSNVQITPGAGTPEEMQAEARRMVDGLQSAGLPTAPVLRETEMP